MPLIRDYREERGVLIFDTQIDQNLSTYDAKHLDELANAEQMHFWTQSRRDKICQIFTRFVQKNARVLEIGGGTGFVAEKLNSLGFDVEMADIHSNSLRYAQNRGVQKLYQFDIFNPPFENEFDVIALFDVLEHFNNPELALKCVKKMLKVGGVVILTVPAHQWLWSRDDVIAGHDRRYSKRSLRKTFLNGDLNPTYFEYFFISILPFLWLRTLIRKDRGNSLNESERFEMRIDPISNKLLALLTKCDFFLKPALFNKVGGSLLGIARC